MSKNTLIRQIALENQLQQIPGTNIAQEGVVDWFKDLFTTKLTLDEISKVRVVVDLLDEVGEESQIPPFAKGTNVNRVRFMLKNHVVSSNLPKDIVADANNLKLLAEALQSTNKALAHVSVGDEASDVIKAMKGVREETVMRLNRTKWLGNFHIEFRKEHAEGDVSTDADGQISKPQLDFGRGSILDIVIGVVVYVISDRAYEQNLKRVNDVVKMIDTDEFVKASKVVEKQFEEILNLLMETYKHVERLKKHDTSEVRHMLRFTRNLAATAIYIAEVYSFFYRHVNNNANDE